MIYTIGYENLTVARMADIISGLGITMLVDCRSRPASRIRGFSRAALIQRYPPDGVKAGRQPTARYVYAGENLGGRGAAPTPKGLDWLRQMELGVIEWTRHTPLLMCKEEAPGDCHRHHRIAVPLLERNAIECRHIYRNQVINASELQAAITFNRKYDFSELHLKQQEAAEQDEGTFPIAT